MKLLIIFSTLIHLSRNAVAYESSFSIIHRVISFEIHGFDRRDNRLVTGSCCDKNDVTKTCKHCRTSIDLHRLEKGNAVTKVPIYFDESQGLSVRKYEYKTLKVDHEKYLRYDIHYTANGNVMEYWMGPSTSTIGMVWMNGVWGHYFKCKIIVTFDHFHPDPTSPIRSFYFYFRRMMWIDRRLSDKQKCCYTSANSYCMHACPFNVSTHIGETELWESPRVPYNGTDAVFFLKTGGSTLDSNAFVEKIKFSVKLNTPEGNLIDEIVVDNLNLFPNQEKELDEVMGNHKNVKIDMILRYDCVSYSGRNCKFDCENTNGKVGCRHDNGMKFCINGAPNFPDCDAPRVNTCLHNPCENGGTCSALPKSHVCYCIRGFIGRYCEIPGCHYECYKGDCNTDTNKCTCEPEYNGEWCDESKCTSAEVESCHKRSKCVRIRDIQKCMCESYATGDKCDTPLCNPDCKAGNCVWDLENKQKHTKCECLPGYTGEACDIYENRPKFHHLDGDIIALSVMSIITYILTKLLILIFLLKPKKERKFNLSTSMSQQGF